MQSILLRYPWLALRRSAPLGALCLCVCAAPAAAQGQLNPELARVLGGDIQNLQLDHEGTRVVYVADQDVDERFELYVVKPSGGLLASVKLNMPLPPAADVAREFALTADGTRVVFRADAESDDQFELYVVPIDGGVPLKLNGPLAPGASIGDPLGTGSFALTPDGTRALYRANAGGGAELFVVALDGSMAPLQLSGTQPGRVWRFRVSPDGTRAFFQELNRPNDLYGVPIDGSQPAVRLSDGAGDVQGYEVSADGAWVVYRASSVLYGVPSDGSAAAHELGALGSLRLGAAVFGIAGTRVVFRARAGAGPDELYGIPLDGSQPRVKLNAALAAQEYVGHFAISPDGGHVAYLVSGGPLGEVDLLAAPSDGSAPAVQLSAPAHPRSGISADLLFSQDSTRVVFRSDAVTDGLVELFSVLADGSAAPVGLSSPIAGGVDALLALAGPRAVFRTAREPLVRELFSVPIAGGPAVNLTRRWSPAAA